MTEYQIKARKFAILLYAIGILCLVAMLCTMPAMAADACQPFASTMVRESQAVYGPDAPAPMFMGQVAQESSCRPSITAPDLGRGLAQFMDGTSKQVAGLFPELGPANPYDPRWAIRAMVRYDGWIYKRMRGADACQKWGAALAGYNGGPGYPMQAQKASTDPLTWFGMTEFIATSQSPANHEYMRTYPRKILFRHQPKYAALGRVTCTGMKA